MAIEYRNATLADLERIVEIYNSTIPGRIVTADTEPVSIASRLAWFHDHDPATRPLWMVMDEQTNVGWMSYQSFYGRPAYNQTAEISIYLHENARGKGYGKILLRHAMDSCESLGIKTLLGYIFAHNERSLNLFRNLGFETWGHFPRIAVLDNVERDLIIVGKRINS